LSYKPSISAVTIIEAMLVAVVVSVLAGLYPAWRASLMEPITALQHL
jgi:ABC-type lipoprotein release transport system permease subunit